MGKTMEWLIMHRRSNQALPFRQAQGPELAEGERMTDRRITRLKEKLGIMKQAARGLVRRLSSCPR